jgi:thiol-disulfide isomerase/thioredoxin
LSSLRGSWVLLHFTASWCPYCDAEIAHLSELSDDYAARGLHVIVVDVKEEAALWTSYARTRVAPSLIALHDALGNASQRFAPPRAQPSFEDRAQVALDSTLIVDPAGTIRLFLMPDSAHFDPTFSAVRRELDRLMAEPTKKLEAGAESVAPERVVTITTTSSGRDVVVTLRVLPGYHIMSDQPSQPNYIPTRVRLDRGDDVELGPPAYPRATPFALSDRSIATFTGDVEIRVPFRVREGGAAAVRTLSGTVSYQACTATRCLFPEKRSISVALAPPR